MTKTSFPLFHQAYPISQEHVSFNFERHGAFLAKIPAPLSVEWLNFGFGAYGKGLLWIPEPDKPLLDPNDWDALDGTGVEVLRTAFADVCVWQNERFLWLSVYDGRVFSYSPHTEIFFDASMTEKYFRKSVFLERLFKIATKRFGNLDSDECFGFAPLPTLGGGISEDYLIKTKMRPYVSLLSQLNN
jgi:hypothetical protein